MPLRIMEQQGELCLIACSGEIRQEDIGANNPLVALLGPECFTRQVLLSFEKVVFIDSRAIGWLLGSYRQFGKAGGRLVIHSLPPWISEVLEFLRLITQLAIAKNLSEAMEMIAQPAT